MSRQIQRAGAHESRGDGDHLRLRVYYIKGCPGPHRPREFEFLPGITHELVTTIQAQSFDGAFSHMQGMNYWAPVEEMRETIRALEGVMHTSMSVSDVLVTATDPAQTAYVCIPDGWMTVRELQVLAAEGAALAFGLDIRNKETG